MGESWRTSVLGLIPALAGLILLTIGALKGDSSLVITGVGLLGGGALGAVARDQAAHKEP